MNSYDVRMKDLPVSGETISMESSLKAVERILDTVIAGEDAFEPVPGSQRNMMVWKTGRNGKMELVHLGEYLLERYGGQMSGSEREETAAQIKAGKILPSFGKEIVHDQIANEMGELLRTGKLAYFPGAKAQMPKSLWLDDRSQRVRVTDLNREPLGERISPPWFLGKGLLTKFILFVSSKARLAEAAYQENQVLHSIYGVADNIKEVKRAVAANQPKAEVKKASTKEEVVKAKTTEFLKQMEQAKQKEQRMSAYFAASPAHLEEQKKKDLLLDRLPSQNDIQYEAKKKEIPSIKEMDMEIINLCSAISAPLYRGAKVRATLETGTYNVKSNRLHIAEGVFRDLIGTDPGRENYHKKEILEDVLLQSVVDGREIAKESVNVYHDGDGQLLAGIISNGLSSMSLMLQNATPEEITDPGSSYGVVIKTIAKTMDFVERHPKVKNGLDISSQTNALCKGWREFSRICEKSNVEQQRFLNSPFKNSTNINAQELLELRKIVTVEQNLKKMCSNTMQTAETVQAVDGEDYFDDTTTLSRNAAKNSSMIGGHLPFIVALGLAPEVIGILDTEPSHIYKPGSKELAEKNVQEYLYLDIPERVKKNEIYDPSNPVWKLGIDQASEKEATKSRDLQQAAKEKPPEHPPEKDTPNNSQTGLTL